MPALSLSRYLADWVTFRGLSWPNTQSRPPAPDLVIKRVALSRAQIFQFPQEAHRKHPAKAASKLRGHKKKSKCLRFKSCTDLFSQHNLPVIKIAAGASYIPVTANFFNWNSTFMKLPKFLQGQTNRNFFDALNALHDVSHLVNDINFSIEISYPRIWDYYYYCHVSHHIKSIFQWLHIKIGWVIECINSESAEV